MNYKIINIICTRVGTKLEHYYPQVYNIIEKSNFIKIYVEN